MEQYQSMYEIWDACGVQDNPDVWPGPLLRQVGTAIWAARTAQGTSVLRLSGRTAELGYPIHRTAIKKIEDAERVVSLPELVILAAALGTTPVALTTTDTGKVEILPGIEVPAEIATGWFTGSEESLSALIDQLNNVDVRLDHQRRNLHQAVSALETFEMGDALRENQRERVELLKTAIRELEQIRASIIEGHVGG